MDALIVRKGIKRYEGLPIAYGGTNPPTNTKIYDFLEPVGVSFNRWQGSGGNNYLVRIQLLGSNNNIDYTEVYNVEMQTWGDQSSYKTTFTQKYRYWKVVMTVNLTSGVGSGYVLVPNASWGTNI